MKQIEEQKQVRFSLKVWLLKKLIQYIDGTFQALFIGAVLGGAFWVVQHIWGLRLIPFNILDTILLVVVTAIVLLAIICLMFWFGLKWLVWNHPEFFVLLGFAALLPILMKAYPNFFSNNLANAANTLKRKQTPPPAPYAPSEQGKSEPQP